MTLLERIKQLCDSREETLASLERKMDFGNGTIRRWDSATPSGDKLAKVADFFQVSVDYLLGRNDSAVPQGLNQIYFSIAKDAQDQGIDPDDIKFMIEFIKKTKEKRND